ncbi:hypothetical protein ACJX0J_020900, partial [Zea mays]
SILAKIALWKILDRLEILNKLDNMKKEYKWFMDSKNNTIDVTIYIKVQKQGPKHFDDLHMFDDVKMMMPHKQQQRRYPQHITIYLLYISTFGMMILWLTTWQIWPKSKQGFTSNY